MGVIVPFPIARICFLGTLWLPTSGLFYVGVGLHRRGVFLMKTSEVVAAHSTVSPWLLWTHSVPFLMSRFASLSEWCIFQAPTETHRHIYHLPGEKLWTPFLENKCIDRKFGVQFQETPELLAVHLWIPKNPWAWSACLLTLWSIFVSFWRHLDNSPVVTFGTLILPTVEFQISLQWQTYNVTLKVQFYPST